jgi:hypothetical protein
MIRLASVCPCCQLQVEWYNDHLTPGGSDLRCGNCFQGITKPELVPLQKLTDAVNALELQKTALYRKFLTG